MKVVEKISLSELKKMAEKMFGSIVKADIDVEKKTVIIDMEMHVDGEQALLESGSSQQNIWGINLKPDHFGSEDFIEFDSMINIRPRQDNPSRDVLNVRVREQIRNIIMGVVHE